MGEDKMDAKVRDKFASKLEVIAKIKELQSDLAKINIDLVRSGAAADVVACW
ncbi:hypothetical protein [Breoghania sp. JC706]|uniref:hypothetical protein n=1 Tax=Breoghania sp. JC706 TaxID=3117732 RepID=UPI00300A2D49